jgi:hypothetical protein
MLRIKEHETHLILHEHDDNDDDIVMSMYSFCMFMYFHRASWHSSATLTEVFPCFFLSCKANAKENPQRRSTARTLPKWLCCSMYCLFCVVLCIVCV